MTDICDHPLDNVYADTLTKCGLQKDTRLELINFLDEMMKTFDIVRTRLADDAPLSHLTPADIRDELQKDHSIIDMANELGCPISEIVNVLTSGSQSTLSVVTEEMWYFYEAALNSTRQWQRTALAEHLGITYNEARTLLFWYHGRPR